MAEEKESRGLLDVFLMAEQLEMFMWWALRIKSEICAVVPVPRMVMFVCDRQN